MSNLKELDVKIKTMNLLETTKYFYLQYWKKKKKN